jgi:hypothetical protein
VVVLLPLSVLDDDVPLLLSELLLPVEEEPALRLALLGDEEADVVTADVEAVVVGALEALAVVAEVVVPLADVSVCCVIISTYVCPDVADPLLALLVELALSELVLLPAAAEPPWPVAPEGW